VAYIDRYIFGILIEPIRHSLALSDTQLSLLQGFAFALFFVLAGLPIGRLVDRYNRRNILFVGVLCWSVASFACGLSHNFEQLFAALSQHLRALTRDAAAEEIGDLGGGHEVPVRTELHAAGAVVPEPRGVKRELHESLERQPAPGRAGALGDERGHGTGMHFFFR